MRSTPAQHLYTIPKAQRDLTRVVWPALGLFLIVVMVSCWAATQYVAAAFGYTPALGTPMLQAGVPIYFPLDVFAWIWHFNRGGYGPAVLRVFDGAHIILGLGAALSLLLPVALIFRRTRKQSGEKNDLHGSAHWATAEEIAATGLLPSEDNAGGVMLGAVAMDNGDALYLRHSGPEHIFVAAPTRSGKGVGIIIPTLLSWAESAVVHDIKGENWHLTSGFRERFLGQRAIKFAPTDPASARFNPLQEVRLDRFNFVRDIQNIATMIVDPDGKGLNDHWAKTGFDLLTGVLAFVLISPQLRANQRCLETVQAILSDGGPIRRLAEEHAKMAEGADAGDGGGQLGDGFRAVMQYICDTATAAAAGAEVNGIAWNLAREAAAAFLNKAKNEASGVLSTALSFLALYRDPTIAENTRSSDFTIESLMQQPTSLYLVLPPTDKDRVKPLTRLIINQITRRLTENMEFTAEGKGKSLYAHRLLMVLDEFPSLGKLEVFQEALAFLAGYGIKALVISQDIKQLRNPKTGYGQEETITSNTHVRVAYAPNNIETGKWLSETCGKATVSHVQRQYSGSRMAMVLQHVNTNEQIVGRDLLTADEAMRLPSTDELVFVAGHAPIYCQKIIYYEDPVFSERVKVGPARSTGRL